MILKSTVIEYTISVFIAQKHQDTPIYTLCVCVCVCVLFARSGELPETTICSCTTSSHGCDFFPHATRRDAAAVLSCTVSLCSIERSCNCSLVYYVFSKRFNPFLLQNLNPRVVDYYWYFATALAWNHLFFYSAPIASG